MSPAMPPARSVISRSAIFRALSRWPALLFSAMLLAGCAAYALVPPGRVAVKEAISIEPDVAWNRINPAIGSNRIETWTLDGLTLNTLTFYVGITDGEPLAARQPTGTPTPPPLPVFRKTMSEADIAELFEATMVRGLAGTSFRYLSIKPAAMGTAAGMLLEFTVTTRDQVDRQGLAIGAVKDGRLYLIVYTGTRLYHFARDRHSIETLFATVRFL